jgi:hypothetical protein
MIFRADMGTAEAGPLGRWRQNAAEVQALDRDELVTVVVGLAGAPGHARVDAIAGSHRLGLLEDVEGRRAPDALSRRRPDDRAVGLEIEPGHALLLHRWLVHRPVASSGPVPSMLAYWFVDGRARSTITGYPELPALVGEVERAPYPCVGVLERQCAALREAADRAEEYARSLERECTRLRGELARRAS